jgi:hypothetical protein
VFQRYPGVESDNPDTGSQFKPGTGFAGMTLKDSFKLDRSVLDKIHMIDQKNLKDRKSFSREILQNLKQVFLYLPDRISQIPLQKNRGCLNLFSTIQDFLLIFPIITYTNLKVLQKV